MGRNNEWGVGQDVKPVLEVCRNKTNNYNLTYGGITNYKKNINSITWFNNYTHSVYK